MRRADQTLLKKWGNTFLRIGLVSKSYINSKERFPFVWRKQNLYSLMTLQPITLQFFEIWWVVSKVKIIEYFYIIVTTDIAVSFSELC